MFILGTAHRNFEKESFADFGSEHNLKAVVRQGHFVDRIYIVLQTLEKSVESLRNVLCVSKIPICSVLLNSVLFTIAKFSVKMVKFFRSSNHSLRYFFVFNMITMPFCFTQLHCFKFSSYGTVEIG